MKKFIMIIMAVALAALPAMAQQELWQSTSSMAGSGSNYSSNVTAVGATGVGDMGTTTSSGSYGPRRAKKEGDGYSDNLDGFDDDTPDYGQGPSPIGDAVLPLLLLACAYLGMRVFLKRKRAMKS